MTRAPIIVERILPAPPHEVFAEWSDAESLSDWMRPAEAMAPATVDLDFRVGGSFRIVMHGDEDFAQHGEYLEIEENRRIVFTWISEWMPPAERRTLVTVSLEPVGTDRTRLLLVHEGLAEGERYAGHDDGWVRILSGLAQRMAGKALPTDVPR